MALFAEFPKPNPQQWFSQIQKELKGAEPASKDRELEPGVVVRAFLPPRNPAFSAPQPLVRPSANWQNVEGFSVNEPGKATNVAILESLDGGADAILLALPDQINKQGLETLLKGVFLEYITLHLAGDAAQNNAGLLLGLLQSISSEKNSAPEKLNLMLHYQPGRVVAGLRPDWRYAVDLLSFSKDAFPLAQLFSISPPNGHQKDKPAAELTDLFLAAHQHISEMSKAGAHPADVVSATFFSVQIGTDFLVETSKLRALQVVWLHVLQAWNLPSAAAKVHVEMCPDAYDQNPNTNMIRAVSMAMAAVIGGANSLVVRPQDAELEEKSQHGEAFSRRIARNVSHILAMESHLDRVVDPAAGSYFFEDLTDQIAREVWARLGG